MWKKNPHRHDNVRLINETFLLNEKKSSFAEQTLATKDGECTSGES
jgi:hypothetical protein